MIDSKMAIIDKLADFFLKSFLDFNSPRLLEKLENANKLETKPSEKHLI